MQPRSPTLLSLLILLLAAGADAFADSPDFSQAGKSFLQKHCLECHSGDEPEAELSLDVFRDSTTAVKGRKTLSKVLKMIESGEMPPKEQPRPPLEEIETFVKIVHAVFDAHDRNAPPDPGRVTMRRLNRTEYRNTIRDLVGVDFDPTEDFPSDDVGYGFDNIGDVLTLPPVLMERYLAAAESIVSRAILPNPPPPTKRYLSTRYSEPAGPNVPMAGKFRPISSDGETPILSGPLNTPYQWEEDGEYVFRARVYTETKGDQPVQIALLLHGQDLPETASDEELAKLSGNVLRPARILKTMEVKASKPDAAEVVEVSVPAMLGRQRMAIGIVKPAEGQPPVKLFVEYLALEGPLDGRPASQRRLLACDPDKPQAAQTREVMRRFAKRAYRRPATEVEVERLAQFVEAALADGEKWEAAIQTAIQAVLCSPKFLFRVELDDRPESPETRALDEFQLASRLSYFLWSTMPDDELFALAENTQLAAKLENQVRRMLQDPKSSALVQNFATQWLQIQRLQSFEPDAKLFPTFDDRLRRSMLEETELFFESVMREDRSILDLLDADYTFLNQTLARHYGIADVNGNWVGQKAERPGGEPIRGRDFVRVSLQGRSRGGLLTQASVLTVTSNPTRTSPVKRGRWVLEQLLGAPPPPPPPNVPELPNDEQAVAGASLRQRMEIHRKNPSCANCHAKMDPLGFALEHYDAIGAFREKDGAFEIDPTGELPDGRKMQGAEDLKTILREMREPFSRCLIEKMLIYALGRGIEYYDKPAIEKILAGLEENDHRFSALVIGIVNSDPFRQRRGSESLVE